MKKILLLACASAFILGTNVTPAKAGVQSSMRHLISVSLEIQAGLNSFTLTPKLWIEKAA